MLGALVVGIKIIKIYVYFNLGSRMFIIFFTLNITLILVLLRTKCSRYVLGISDVLQHAP